MPLYINQSAFLVVDFTLINASKITFKLYGPTAESNFTLAETRPVGSGSNLRIYFNPSLGFGTYYLDYAIFNDQTGSYPDFTRYGSTTISDQS